MFDISGFLSRNFEDQSFSGEDVRVNCFKCGDTNKHLYVGLHIEAVHCFKCGYSASWIKFVMDCKGCNYWIAVGELYHKPRMVDFHIVQDVPNVLPPTIKKLPDGFMRLADTGLPAWSDYAKKYLKKRGFTGWHWNRYALGVSNEYPMRIIIPIEKEYWQGRAIFDFMTPKYINPKVPARDVLFNAQALRVYNEVVITEGAFSAMAVGENAVALIGKEPTEEKIERIVGSLADHFIIALEPEAYGTMKKLIDALYSHGKTITIWKYEVGDPADPNGVFKEIEYSLRFRIEMLLNL